MSQPTAPPTGNPLYAPFPTLGQLFPRALRWAFLAALIGTAFYGGWLIFAWIFFEPTGTAFPAGYLVERCGIAWLVLFAVLVPARLLWLSRALADRMFALVGFTATFFGLAMLTIFFASLGLDTYRWFQITPKLVEARNQQLRAYIAAIDPEQELARIETMLKQSRQASLEQAQTEEEKQQIRDTYADLIAYARQQEARTVQEKLESAKISIREDTSAWGIFVHFLSHGPSSVDDPQNAGIYPAILGSLWIALITMLFAVPVGIGAALYLEEYRTKSWLGNLIQVNINNLAGIPSVVYGILGAFIFVEMIFKQIEQHVNPDIAARNVLGGGLTLGLLTLPIVIVSTQEAIRAVPKSIREGAYALGATQWQVIWRNVLPMASPGIFTGTILSVSRAIGEAAPLVLFGALLFVNQEPGLFSRFTVLPMQIFGWADRPPVQGEEIWQYNAAVASMVLLIMLLGLNALAIFLRNRAQQHMRY